MKCPLQHTSDLSLIKGHVIKPIDCLKEECAWWLEDVSLCAIKEIALEFRYTQLRLADIIEKSPSKGEGGPQ